MWTDAHPLYYSSFPSSFIYQDYHDQVLKVSQINNQRPGTSIGTHTAFILGCGDTLFLLDMNFLFLTLATLLPNGGQLHRLMVEKRTYFISPKVVRLSDFSQEFQQTQQLPPALFQWPFPLSFLHASLPQDFLLDDHPHGHMVPLACQPIKNTTS